MTSYRKNNIASEKILYILYLFQIRILAEERLEFWLCCFQSLRQEQTHDILFFLQKNCV